MEKGARSGSENSGWFLWWFQDSEKGKRLADRPGIRVLLTLPWEGEAGLSMLPTAAPENGIQTTALGQRLRSLV